MNNLGAATTMRGLGQGEEDTREEKESTLALFDGDDDYCSHT